MKKCVLFSELYTVCALLTYAGLAIYEYFQLPYFSVITSVYNYEKYVGDTITSVLASDYPRFEMIIINDGSTDHSLEVIEKYAAKDKRIRIINQKNSGLSIARNKGMNIAKGDYFWFVDADDYIDPKALSKLAKQIKKTNRPDLISFFIQPIDENGVFQMQDGYSQLPKTLKNYRNTTFDGRSFSVGMIAGYPVTSGKQIYSKDFLKKHKIYFIPNLTFEDDVFFLSTLEAGARGTAMFETLYYKRNHNQSIVNNRSRYYDSTVKLPIIIYEELKRAGVREERARVYFNVYYQGVFDKFPESEQGIKDIDSVLDYVNKNYAYWKNNKERLEKFVAEKKQKYGRKE